MAQVVDTTLSKKGSDTGNFTVTPLDTSGIVITTAGWPKTSQSFTQGVAIRYSDVPDTAFQLNVQSTGSCTIQITTRFKS